MARNARGGLLKVVIVSVVPVVRVVHIQKHRRGEEGREDATPTRQRTTRLSARPGFAVIRAHTAVGERATPFLPFAGTVHALGAASERRL